MNSSNPLREEIHDTRKITFASVTDDEESYVPLQEKQNDENTSMFG
jgi:hypothetical protein